METVTDDLAFPEGIRWHDGSLWLSDIHRHRVLRVFEDGRQEVVVELGDRPSGLGFAPNGDLYVVSLLDRLLLKVRAGAARPVADLTPFADKFANDMITDGLGRSYVGCRNVGDPGAPTDCLVLVDGDGRASLAAGELVTPNGVVVSPAMSTLVVAETHVNRLTAFDIGIDGTLHNRRLFADVEGAPDGICLDEEGAVWAALPQESAVVRIVDGGEVAQHIPVPDLWPFTCVLGGTDRRTMFIAAGRSTMANFARLGLDRHLDHTSESRGFILSTRVDVPGAGWP